MLNSTTILKTLIFFVITLVHQNTFSQVVFAETFNESNNATSGTDNVGGVSWSSTCATCLSGDHWYVVNGMFEGQDTNGDAIWETSAINAASCANVEVSFTISESGTMEACGTGCNSADWVSFQYNVDGSGWQDPANSFFCSGGCAGINVIASSDLPGGSMTYSSGCIPVGNTIQLRITVQNWAGTEFWRIDDVSVACACSVLPIELAYFDAQKVEDQVQLNWLTASEVDNAFFTVERSADAVSWNPVVAIQGAGTSMQPQSYNALDSFPFQGISYYRLKQTDFNGAFEYSEIRAVDFEFSGIKVFPNPSNAQITLTGKGFQLHTPTFFNVLGQDVSTRVSMNENSDQRMTLDISALESGTYFIRSRENTVTFTKM